MLHISKLNIKIYSSLACLIKISRLQFELSKDLSEPVRSHKDLDKEPRTQLLTSRKPLIFHVFSYVLLAAYESTSHKLPFIQQSSPVITLVLVIQ